MTKPSKCESGNRSYRRQYSAKLRASLSRASETKRDGRHRKLMVMSVVTLLAMIGLGGVGLFCLERYRADMAVGNGTAQAMAVVNTATAGDADSQLVIPYNTTIGFVGDSLTYGCCNDSTPAPSLEVANLGNNYRAINRGVNGSTTRDWMDSLLTPAIEEFQANGVEIVQIMLGTNDVGRGIVANDTVDNLRQIAKRLQDSGVKLIIVNKIPYSGRHSDTRVRQLNVALDELIDGELPIYLGDDQAYDYFREHQSHLYDGIHMDQDGYAKLAELWESAFRRVVVEPSLTGRSLSANNYVKESGNKMLYSVDKSSYWFATSLGDSSGIAIDDNLISADDYSIVESGDKTAIEVRPEFLDGLSAGQHTITMRFVDGVSFSMSFTVDNATNEINK